MIGVGVSVAMVAVGVGGLLVLARKLRKERARIAAPRETSPIEPTPAPPEDEHTDVVITGVPWESGETSLEPQTARHGPWQRLRAWDVTPPDETRPGVPPVRAIQVENGPIVQLQTTEE